MLKKSLIALSLFTAIISAQEVKTPAQIEQEIQQAQHDFEIAKKMFTPYYTGPLITGSANNVPMGHVNLQPYLYFTTNYAQFNKHRHSQSTPNTYILNPLLVFQVGITLWMDFTVIPQSFFKWKKGHNAQEWGDTSAQVGFQLVKEQRYVPAFRLIIGEVFPSGKYKWLDSDKMGIDGTGAGVYSTSVGLNISKVLWWFKLHPMQVRLASQYLVPNARTRVHGFNSYGGGHHTDGKVKVGNTLSLDLGVEVSLTQKWAFATDFVYTYSNKSSFEGRPGTVHGLPAGNGAPSNDNFSIAPAIEYNVSENGGFIGGLWFSAAGRNSANFISLVLSYTQLF